MKKRKSTFSGILVGTLLLVFGIGLIWFNQGSNVNSVSGVKYNAWNSLEAE